MTNLLLNSKLLTIHSITEEKTIHKNFIEKVTVIKVEIWTTYQSQRKWLQQQYKHSQNYYYYTDRRTLFWKLK